MGISRNELARSPVIIQHLMRELLRTVLAHYVFDTTT